MVSTLQRKHAGFDSPYFRALGYSDELINKFAKARNKGSGEGSADHPHRANILRAYQYTKKRLQAVLRYRRNFSTRIEFTVNLIVLEHMASREGALSYTDIAAMRPDAAIHAPFYALPSDTVCEFFVASINRWLVLLERTTHMADPRRAHQPSSVFAGERTEMTEEELGIQLHYTPVVALALDAIRFHLNGSTYIHYDLWKQRWVARDRRSRRSRQAGCASSDAESSSGNSSSDDGDTDTDEDGDNARKDRPSLKSGGTRLGMDFQRTVATYGVPWLPEHLVVWHSDPPTFPVPIRDQLVSYRSSYFTKPHYKLAAVRTFITADNARVRTFVQVLRDSVETDTIADTLYLAAELCVQEAAIEILKDLETLFARDEEVRVAAQNLDKKAVYSHVLAARDGWNKRAPAHLLEGFKGICARSIGTLFDSNPIEIAEMTVPYLNINQCSRIRLRKTDSIYNTGQWCDRIFSLFNWDRPGVSDPYQPKRSWDNKQFRAFTRTLYGIIDREVGRQHAESFLTVQLPLVAGGSLLAVPAVERTSFFQYTTARAQYKLPTVKFWIPRFTSSSLQSEYRELMLGERDDPEFRKDYLSKLAYNLHVWQSGSRGENMTYEEIPIGACYINGRLPLQRAFDFAKLVDKRRRA
jgi:hypothetical protein